MKPTKRRRLDAVSSTSFKPFHSPLKCHRHDKTAFLQKQQDLTSQSPAETGPWKHTEPSAALSPTLPVAVDDVPDDDDVTRLQKRYSCLSQRLKHRKEDLDAAEQALKILSDNEEEQLNALTLKWRAIARDTADDVFASASSKVKDMGGLKAWRKNNTLDRTDDCRLSDSKSERSLSNTADLANNGAPCDRNLSTASSHEENEEQDFTMDMMLSQLGIDRSLLDFDEILEQWKD